MLLLLEIELFCEVLLIFLVLDEVVSFFILFFNGFLIRLGIIFVWLVGESVKFFKCVIVFRIFVESFILLGFCLMCFLGFGCLWFVVRILFDMFFLEGISFLGRIVICWCFMSFINFFWFFRIFFWFFSSFFIFYNSVVSCLLF